MMDFRVALAGEMTICSTAPECLGASITDHGIGDLHQQARRVARGLQRIGADKRRCSLRSFRLLGAARRLIRPAEAGQKQVEIAEVDAPAAV